MPWVDPEAADDARLKGYELDRLVLTDGHQVIQFEPRLVYITGQRVTVRLPELCRETLPRAVRRHGCEGVKANIVANSAVYEGRVIDFSAQSFRVELLAVPPQSFDWISASLPVNVTLHSGKGVIYVGDCRIVRQHHGRGSARLCPATATQPDSAVSGAGVSCGPLRTAAVSERGVHASGVAAHHESEGPRPLRRRLLPV